MNTYKKLNNKRFKAEKAFWNFETDEANIEFHYLPQGYIATNRKLCYYAPWKYSAEETVEFLMEHGHKPCSYIQMLKMIYKHNIELEEWLDNKIEEIRRVFPDQDTWLAEEPYYFQYHDQLLYTWGCRTNLKKKIKI